MSRSINTLLFIIISLATQAQGDIVRAVILINGQATVADITEKGEVIATLAEVENYFSSNKSTRQILAQYNEQPPAGSIEQPVIAIYEAEVEPEVPFAAENKRPISTGINRYIGFSPRRALLNDAAVLQVREIAESQRTGQIGQIVIYSFHDRSYRSRSLARNRAEAIKGLLGAFAVPFQRIDILIEPMSEGARENFVRVSF